MDFRSSHWSKWCNGLTLTNEKMKLKLQSLLILSLLFFSCKEQEHSEKKTSFENKGHELVYEMVQKVGNYSKLAEKKDVVYTYKYQTPDGKTDLSTEKYIFDGELSYGAYEQHERTLLQHGNGI